MSDTPRTDTEEQSTLWSASENDWRVKDGGWVSVGFARELERKLSEADAFIAENWRTKGIAPDPDSPLGKRLAAKFY